MGQGVIHQIAQQFVEQRRFAAQPDRLVRFQRQGHAALVGQRRHGHAQLTRQLAEVEQLRAALGNRPGTVFHPGQGEQLIG
ncbi:hypothetical protein D3C73_974590 [compost metagenome]